MPFSPSRWLKKLGGTLTGLLQFSGTTHAGLRLNNLTTAQRDALTPTAGMVIYNTTTARVETYQGGAWLAYAKLTGDTLTGLIQFSGTGHYGLKLNSLTTAQRDALAPSNGLLIYNTTTATVQQYVSGAWSSVPAGAAVTSVFGRTGAVLATSGDYNATQVTNTPAGSIAATTVQAAVNELDTEKQATITGGATTITASNLTASRALASDGSGKVAVSATTATELGHVAGVTSAVQTQLNGKQATITGAATTIDTEDLTVSRALVSDASGKVAVSATTATELGYLAGVTSAVQTQLDGKLTSALSGVGAWTARDSNRNWQRVASSSDGTKLVTCVLSGFIYTSTDSGATWTQRSVSDSWRGVASSSDGVKLVAVGEATAQIRTSTDSGANWTTRHVSHSYRAVASSTDGAKLVAVVYTGFIYTSTDSGVNWTERATIEDWTAVASSADGTKLVAAVSSGQLYTSTDSGATWTARDSSRNWSDVASSSDGTKLVAVVQSGQIYTSTDSGVTWTARDSSRNWLGVTSSTAGTKLVATVNAGTAYTSTDSGVTWTARVGTQAWRYICASDDASKLLASTASSQLYTATDLKANAVVSTDSTGNIQTATNEATRTNLGFLTATASLNFGNILAAGFEDLTITVTGAAVGDAAFLGRPAAEDSALHTEAIVTAADTVTVRAQNVGSLAVDQPALTYRATVIR